MKQDNYINYIFFFNCKGKPFVKIMNGHKYGQAQVVKRIKAEFGEDIEFTDLLLEGEQSTPVKSYPPLITGLVK